MHRTTVLSLFYAVLLIACALFAGFQIFGWLFVIGETDRQPAAWEEALLICTGVGAVGLLITSFGSWMRHKSISMIALVSALLVLPVFAQYFLGYGMSMSDVVGPLDWENVGVYVLPAPLDLVVAWWSWSRFRQFSKAPG